MPRITRGVRAVSIEVIVARLLEPFFQTDCCLWVKERDASGVYRRRRLEDHRPFRNIDVLAGGTVS